MSFCKGSAGTKMGCPTILVDWFKCNLLAFLSKCIVQIAARKTPLDMIGFRGQKCWRYPMLKLKTHLSFSKGSASTKKACPTPLVDWFECNLLAFLSRSIMKIAAHKTPLDMIGLRGQKCWRYPKLKMKVSAALP